jgi:hypothetical protein
MEVARHTLCSTCKLEVVLRTSSTGYILACSRLLSSHLLSSQMRKARRSWLCARLSRNIHRPLRRKSRIPPIVSGLELWRRNRTSPRSSLPSLAANTRSTWDEICRNLSNSSLLPCRRLWVCMAFASIHGLVNSGLGLARRSRKKRLRTRRSRHRTRSAVVHSRCIRIRPTMGRTHTRRLVGVVTLRTTLQELLRQRQTRFSRF